MSKAHELGQGTPQCESWASQRGPPALGRWQPTSGGGPWTPGASVILASEEWMEPRRLSHGADVSIRWDKAHAQGMARAQEATIFNFLSVIIIRSACEEEGRRPPGDPHCHGFISGPQGLGDGPPRTTGTSAKWLLGSRKAEGKCCLRLFDLWRGGGTRSCRGRWGGGCGLQATLPLPAAHCLWDRWDCLPLCPSPSVPLCPHLLTGQGCPLRSTRLRGNTAVSSRGGLTLHPPGRPRRVWAGGCSGKIQGTWCLGSDVAQPRCSRGDPFWALPQGHIPDMAGAG